MRYELSWAAFIVVMTLSMGCARVEKVRAVEGDGGIPYETIGTLEIKEKAPLITGKGVLWTGVEVATLTMAKTPSRAEQYKKSLRKKLAKKARKNYGADGVVKVEYWPDPAQRSFPYGYVYARGEMIRYKKFPQPELTASSVTAS